MPSSALPRRHALLSLFAAIRAGLAAILGPACIGRGAGVIAAAAIVVGLAVVRHRTG